MWSCFYRNTSCEEAVEKVFVSVRTVASSRQYLLSTPKWGQGSEVSCESNCNNHFANRCISIDAGVSFFFLLLFTSMNV